MNMENQSMPAYYLRFLSSCSNWKIVKTVLKTKSLHGAVHAFTRNTAFQNSIQLEDKWEQKQSWHNKCYAQINTFLDKQRFGSFQKTTEQIHGIF